MASPPAGAVACVYSHACTAWARNPDDGAISPNWRLLTSRDHPGASAAACRISVSNSHLSKHRDRTRPRSARVALSLLGSSDDHIHLPAAAPGTHKPVAPIENRRVRAVSNSHFSGVRLDLMAACLPPHDQPHLGIHCIAECHRRAERRFHEPRTLIPEIGILRAAQLMIKRYGDKALEESATRADELARAGNDGGGSWRPSSSSRTGPRQAGSTKGKNLPLGRGARWRSICIAVLARTVSYRWAAHRAMPLIRMAPMRRQRPFGRG
jgi:hypothetical protein